MLFRSELTDVRSFYWLLPSVIQPILGLALNSLLDDNTFDAAAEVWSEIMSSKAASKHQETICEGLMPCFASEWARAKHLESIQGTYNALQQVCTGDEIIMFSRVLIRVLFILN